MTTERRSRAQLRLSANDFSGCFGGIVLACSGRSSGSDNRRVTDAAHHQHSEPCRPRDHVGWRRADQFRGK